MKRYAKFKNILRSASKKKQEIHTPQQPVTKISDDLTKNKEILKQQFGNSTDIVYRPFYIYFEDGSSLSAMLVLSDGLSDQDAARNNIIKPLQNLPFKQHKQEDTLSMIQNKISSFQPVTRVSGIEEAVLKILKGHAFLIIEGEKQGLLVDIAGFEVRALEEPQTERTVRGAREGFIESISTNINLIRRRIPHPSLQFESLEIGTYGQTKVAITYMKDMTDPKLVQEVKERLQQVKVDSVNSSGFIEQVIEDHPYSIFPTIGNTERPDLAASLIMEGRVVILVDQDPFALYAPYFFLENVKNIEDYSSRPYFASFVRIIRLLAFIAGVLFPALYIAVMNFHKVMIPSDMVVPFIQARESVPFPLSLEVLLVIFMFEIVREAGVRLPEQVGSALSIVGALIFGQVAVSAGIVGAPTAIVVSISYIASYVNNPLADAISLIRIGLFLAASLFGGYGVIIALLTLLSHMVSLTSLGIPYMAPLAPFYLKDWKDSFLRFPYRLLKNKPDSIPSKKKTRIQSLPKLGGKS